MRKILTAIAFVALTSLGGTQALAGLIEVLLVPSVDKIHPPQSLFVDINISGLQSGGVDNLLGAWSMDILYESDLFVPLLVPPAGFGDRLGNVSLGETIGGVDTATPGTIGLYLVSLLFDFELDALQRDAAGNLLDSFKLATLGFFAPGGTGSSDPSTFIATTSIVLSDPYGNQFVDINSLPLSIQHLPVRIRVPEPATLALVAMGLIGALITRRRPHRQSA